MTITFNMADAQAAEDRAENAAEPLPGDKELIEALDGWRGQQWDAYWEPIHQAEAAEQNRLWLTQQCPSCEDGGTGVWCDEHRPTVCPKCGLKTWDAPDLIPGDMVCVCDDPFEDAA